ncbi:aspartic peptidase domain-containing protein [Halenospora varia]|nr:aspartic peptidase domain-containing protein [Halenospora varia]
MRAHSFLLSFFLFPLPIPACLPPLHFPISRRGGAFPVSGIADIPHLLGQLAINEARFNATTREFTGNRVVRVPKKVRGTQAATVLLGEVGREGNWYTTLPLDMLSADWWVVSTKSDKGSFFLDFNSKTYVDSESPLSFPTCRLPIDILHLFAIRRTQWSRALLPNGAYLGLAPSTHLSQLRGTSLMPQLIEREIIDRPMWSIVLLNSREGLFSMGGTAIATIKEIEKESESALLHNGGHEELKRGEEFDWEGDWKWLKVQGSEGWWQISMDGIWVEGEKILRQQPIILDVNTPFIIAPPQAAQTFYASISGSRQLPEPHDQFYAYPYLNPPQLHYEFGGWKAEVLKGKRDPLASALGGRLSLGRIAVGSGYCIGVVVESRMGVGEDGGNGLADTWIIGEPFFRDVHVAFDWKLEQVGMQRV